MFEPTSSIDIKFEHKSSQVTGIIFMALGGHSGRQLHREHHAQITRLCAGQREFLASIVAAQIGGSRARFAARLATGCKGRRSSTVGSSVVLGSYGVRVRGYVLSVIMRS